MALGRSGFRWGITPRGLAMFAGGASIGVMAGRFLPPLLMQTGAWLGNADPFALLAEDHRTVLGLLGQMEESAGSGIALRTQLLLRVKRKLAAHAMAEEDVVYPLLKEEAGEGEDAARLYSEHGAMKTHLYALERLLGNGSAYAQRAAQLKQLVAEHARTEEEVEFPRLRALLGQEDMARLARHVRREKAMVV